MAPPRRTRFAFSVCVFLLLAATQDPVCASTYDDLLGYLQAVGNGGKNFVVGLLAPRFDVRRALELLRAHLRKPWPAVGLPRLDPLDARNISFHLDDPELGSWSGVVDRIRMLGLADFHAESLEVEPLKLRLSFNISWHRLDAAGRYVLNGSLANVVPTRGRGPFNVTLWDLRVGGTVLLGAERPTLYVRELSLWTDLGAATGRIQGLRGNRGRGPGLDSPRALMVSELLSETVLEMAPEMVRVAGPRLAAQLAGEARAFLDARLRDTRATSMNALAWARAVATERVFALGRLDAARTAPPPRKWDEEPTEPWDASRPSTNATDVQ